MLYFHVKLSTLPCHKYCNMRYNACILSWRGLSVMMSYQSYSWKIKNDLICNQWITFLLSSPRRRYVVMQTRPRQRGWKTKWNTCPLNIGVGCLIHPKIVIGFHISRETVLMVWKDFKLIKKCQNVTLKRPQKEDIIQRRREAPSIIVKQK